jgi:hypothetical protein
MFFIIAKAVFGQPGIDLPITPHLAGGNDLALDLNDRRSLSDRFRGHDAEPVPNAPYSE